MYHAKYNAHKHLLAQPPPPIPFLPTHLKLSFRLTPIFGLPSWIVLSHIFWIWGWNKVWLHEFISCFGLYTFWWKWLHLFRWGPRQAWDLSGAMSCSIGGILVRLEGCKKVFDWWSSGDQRIRPWLLSRAEIICSSVSGILDWDFQGHKAETDMVFFLLYGFLAGIVSSEVFWRVWFSKRGAFSSWRIGQQGGSTSSSLHTC